MPTEAQILIREIQYKTGKTLEQIADDIDYSRPYLNNIKLNGGGEKVVEVLKRKYGKILQNVSTNQKVKELIPGPDADLLSLMRFERELQHALATTKQRIEKLVKG